VEERGRGKEGRTKNSTSLLNITSRRGSRDSRLEDGRNLGSSCIEGEGGGVEEGGEEAARVRKSEEEMGDGPR